MVKAKITIILDKDAVNMKPYNATPLIYYGHVGKILYINTLIFPARIVEKKLHGETPGELLS